MKSNVRDASLDRSIRWSHRQHPSDREAIFGEVGLEVDDHLTAIAVRAGNAADEQPINLGL